MVLESDDCEDMVITALLHEAVEDRGGFPRVAEIRNCDRVANIKYPARQLCAAMISYLDSMAWQIKACKIAQDVPTPRSGRGRKAPATPAKLRWTPKRPRPEQRATHNAQRNCKRYVGLAHADALRRHGSRRTTIRTPSTTSAQSCGPAGGPGSRVETLRAIPFAMEGYLANLYDLSTIRNVTLSSVRNSLPSTLHMLPACTWTTQRRANT
jgi:hypothetical protein